jgi:glycosyltransferase involved in cell wall biosynthesis
MKKILHLIETSGPGGAEKILISLLEHLDKSIYQSCICLLKDGWLNAQLKGRGFETFIVPQPHSLDFAWLWEIKTRIKNMGIHLMHAHEFTMNTYASLLSVFTGVPIIATIHGKNYYWERWWRRLAYRFVSRQSTMVAVSEDIKKFLVQKAGIKNDRIIVVHNGIDLDLYRPESGKGEWARKELCIRNAQPVVGAIGNLYPVKGHTYLLKALAIVKIMFPTIKLLIAGRGRMMGKLLNESQALGVQDHVIFLGFREDTASLLQAIDLFVLPSISEGLPLSVLEAMASGKPVIATNVGGLPEVVVDGQTGFLVSPEDPESLAKRMMLLLGHSSLADQFGKVGRARAEKKFSLVSMVQKYQELYERV